jgi:hypothetical protein
VIFTLRGSSDVWRGGLVSPGPAASIAFMLSRLHLGKLPCWSDGGGCPTTPGAPGWGGAPIAGVCRWPPSSWPRWWCHRSPRSQRGAHRRTLGAPQNRPLRRGRVLLHPAPHPGHPLLAARGLSHGAATTMVFSLGLIAFHRPGLPLRSPLVTAPCTSATRSPTWSGGQEGSGPAGPAGLPAPSAEVPVRGSSQITKQVTKVLKPATAFSWARPRCPLCHHRLAIAVLTLLHHARGPRLWRGFLTSSARPPRCA